MTFEFVVRREGEAVTVASVSNDGGQIVWAGNPETIQNLQAALERKKIDITNDIGFAAIKRIFGGGSYFSVMEKSE